MGTIADKLLYLNESKKQIKNAIIAKGVSIADGTPFRDYAAKIASITTAPTAGVTQANTLMAQAFGSSSSNTNRSLTAINALDNNINCLWYQNLGTTTDVNYTTSYTSPEMKLLKSGKFELSAAHYDLSDSRVNSNILFYDSNMSYLGKLVYSKDSSTWSRSDYSTCAFYNASNGLIYDVPVSNFSGTSYGNGALYSSIDLSDSNKIIFYPHTYTASSHYFSVVKTFTYSHPFASAKYVKLQTVNFRAGYYKGAPSMTLSNVFGGLFPVNVDK